MGSGVGFAECLPVSRPFLYAVGTRLTIRFGARQLPVMPASTYSLVQPMLTLFCARSMRTETGVPMNLSANACFFCSPSSMRRATLRFFSLSGTWSGMEAAFVPGRLLYGKTCRLEKGRSCTRSTVFSNARASSPGSPTIRSVPRPSNAILLEA